MRLGDHPTGCQENAGILDKGFENCTLSCAIDWVAVRTALRIDGLHLLAHEGDGFGQLCLGQSVKNHGDIKLEIV